MVAEAGVVEGDVDEDGLEVAAVLGWDGVGDAEFFGDGGAGVGEEWAVAEAFARRVIDTKCALLRFLVDARADGKTVAAYGAPAKGNTLLNFIGARTDFIDFTVDRNPNKQGLFLPGTAVPVLPVEALVERKPDYVLILPWNLASEIMDEQSALCAGGSRFIIPMPRPIIV